MLRRWIDRLRRASLRTKIIAWSFLPTSVVLTAVAAVAFGSYLRAAEDLILEQNQDLARFAALQLEDELEKYADLLIESSRNAGLADLQAADAEAALDSQRERLLVFDGGALLLDGHGRVMAASPRRPELSRADLSGRDYFRLLVRSERPEVSDLISDGEGQSPVVSIAVPVLGDGGEFRGALVGMFRLGRTTVSALYGDILRLRVVEQGATLITDGKGRVIYHTRPNEISADYSHMPLVGRALAGEFGAARTVNAEGQDVLASFANVPGTRWAMVAEESWSTVVAPIRNRQLALLLLLGMGVLVPGLIVMFGVRRLTQPIVDLVVAAQRVARGEFGKPIRSGTGDEIEELAIQFNAVAEQLRDSDSKLIRSRALAVAEERQRLARDLHDAVTQTLFSASITAEVLPRIWERDHNEGLRRLEELRHLARGALAEMRTLLLELRPSALAEASLPDLLRQLSDALRSRARVEVQLQVEGRCDVPPDVRLALYRIAQEALNNIAKHSQANQVWIQLHCDPKLSHRLTIRDDGEGFDMAEISGDNLGLVIMRERSGEIGAELHIESSSGHGTTVEVAWEPEPDRSAVHA